MDHTDGARSRLRKSQAAPLPRSECPSKGKRERERETARVYIGRYIILSGRGTGPRVFMARKEAVRKVEI